MHYKLVTKLCKYEMDLDCIMKDTEGTCFCQQMDRVKPDPPTTHRPHPTPTPTLFQFYWVV